jgi:hypothetical protein
MMFQLSQGEARRRGKEDASPVRERNDNARRTTVLRALFSIT